MSTILRKTVNWYNPFTLTYPDGFKGVEIENINFYKDGKVIANTKWFTNNNEFRLVELPFDVKRSNKLNLDRKDAFTIKSKDIWSSKYDLYIHADLMPSLKSLGRSDAKQNWFQSQTHEIFEITLHGIKESNVDEPIKDHTLRFDCNYEFTDTDEYKKCVKLCKDMKETCGADISEYRMHEILQYYNITKKRK